MKFAEINKKFTDTVAEWIGKGYVINTTSMNGSQGEIAKVDMTDGKEIIRILLNTEQKIYTNKDKLMCYCDEIITLTVGRATGRAKPLNYNSFDTIWNNALEVISCEEFYKIAGPDRDTPNTGWWGTKEEAHRQQEIQVERMRARRVTNVKEFTDEKAKEIVLPFVRRQPKCKSVRIDEIDMVRKDFEEDCSYRYVVNVRGRKIVIR